MTHFGHYELRGLLGRGGMGEVYEAFDREQERLVALKVLPEALASDEAFAARFKRESFIAAQLTEPHVIPIHRYGDIDGRLYIDMRLVRGSDLAAIIERTGPLPVRRTIALLTQAAQALDAANAQGLIHRDVKPSNLLVTAQDFVYLVDFGIAHAIGVSPAGTQLTATGAPIGTLDYMAPERFDGRAGVDRRPDVYSLACVLYECLTGRRPFPVTGLPALMRAHLHEPPPLLTAARPDLPRSLDRVIARGMAKNPDDRHPTAGDLIADADRALRDGAGIATPPAPLPQSPVTPEPITPPPPHTPPPPYTPPLLTPPAARVPASGPPPALGSRKRIVAWTAAAVGVVLVAVLGAVLLPRLLADDTSGGGGIAAVTPATSGSAPPTTSAPSTSRATTSAPPPTTPSTPQVTTVVTTITGTATNVVTTTVESASTVPGPPNPPTPASKAGDLGLEVPIANQLCTGRYITLVGASVDPAMYRSEMYRLLGAYYGSQYLLTEESCGSLEARSDAGNSIYAVYLGPFDTAAEACAARQDSNSYVKLLNPIDPAESTISC